MSVDVSASALARGDRNLEINGCEHDHRAVAADVFDVLKKLARTEERFDLVILDPPTFSTTRSSRWSSGTGWQRLADAAFGVLASGAHVLACSNAGGLPARTLERYLREAAERSGRRSARIEKVDPPPDFPSPRGHESPLKTFVLRP